MAGRGGARPGAGRPPGCKRAAAELEAELVRGAEPVVKDILERAREGDEASRRMLLDHLARFGGGAGS